MFNLYKQVLDKNKSTKGLIPVDKMVSDSCLASEVSNKLTSMGYVVQGLSYRQKAILFTALCDIIMIVKDNQYYLATLCGVKLQELHQLGRIIPNAGEKDLSNVDKLLKYNTTEVINQYLLQGKFHLIKLNVYDKCRTSFTLVSVSGMNPYPTLESEHIYSLSQVGAWHNELHNTLVKGIYKLKLVNGVAVCQSYLSSLNSVCTGGTLLTKDIHNDVIEIPLWNIQDYEPYSDVPFVQQLYQGVVKYDDQDITLNRDILEKYYGKELYKLESKGVRYRYCYEELLSIRTKYSLAYYINKYNLDIYDCADIYELQSKLKGLLEKHDDKSIVNARVLTSAKSILSGHKSFYVRINITKLDTHKIKVIENISDVMPKLYKYYAISPSLGYNCVEVTATSDNLALKYGCTEFERQFGGESQFISLMVDDKLLKGSRPYKFSIDIQRRLCQNIMYGYNENYQGYAPIIYDMLQKNGLTCTDEAIQLLYINNLARKYKHGADVKFIDVMSEFIKFCDLVNQGYESKLNEEKAKISQRMCTKEYSRIEQALPELKGYKVDDTPEGKFVVTKYGRFKVGKSVINKTVELYYNNVFLKKVILK